MLFNALLVAILRDAAKTPLFQRQRRSRCAGMTANKKPGWNFQPGFELRRVRSV
jgi:phosphopantetheine adenylyltransferase